MTTWQTTEQTVTWTSTAGTTWQVVRGSTGGGGGGGGAVDSVNGETGAVVLDAADVGALASGSGYNTANGWLKLDGSGTAPDSTLPASIARDSEVSSAISAHAAATDPHGDRAYSVQRANHTGTQAQSTVTDLTTDLAAKAPLASPTFTGTPAAPTSPQGTNTTQVATTAYVQTEVGLMVPKSVVDAAGDLLVGTGADAVGTLTLGTRGHTLVAGATSPEYRAIGSVRSFGGIPPKAGEWVLLGPSGSSSSASPLGTTTSNSNNTIRYVPFEINKRTGVEGLGLEITTGNAGGSAVLRLGIHESSDGRPGVVRAQGTAGLGSTGAKEITWTEVVLEPGWYWAALGMQSLDTGGTNPAIRWTGGAMAQSSLSSVPASSTAHNQRLYASVSGSLTDNPTVSQETGSAMPALFLKVSTP